MRRAAVDGNDRRLLVVVRDITERKAAQERMEFLSYHDALTLLPNRLLVQDHAPGRRWPGPSATAGWWRWSPAGWTASRR